MLSASNKHVIADDGPSVRRKPGVGSIPGERAEDRSLRGAPGVGAAGGWDLREGFLASGWQAACLPAWGFLWVGAGDE
jgi:hypothetical protein